MIQYWQDLLVSNCGSFPFSLGDTKVFSHDIEYMVVKTRRGQLVFPSRCFHWHHGCLHYCSAKLAQVPCDSLEEKIRTNLYSVSGLIYFSAKVTPQVRLTDLKRRHRLKPEQLHAVKEAIKISFSEKMSVELVDGELVACDGQLVFSLKAVYEIIGAFVSDRRIKVLVKVERIDCHDLYRDNALISLKNDILKTIAKNVPDSLALVDIIITDDLTLIQVEDHLYAGE